MRVYTVVVGNVGTVYDGISYLDAKKKWHSYVEMSKLNMGRAGGESVVLMIDDEIEDEYEPKAYTRE